ncbi:HtaA domain-containing protein [Streptomyces sp. CRN 30]|uniref:HtaA domain-containing protein n=1 Tax=Streptomyces sp. CRN 30 TaxID=3075613 RepID=UPI002A835867|nr:HtaA domain-containing protein [Streptomyces sp. CRN 30]
MAKRPGAAVTAGGVLLALLGSTAARAEDGGAFPREVTGGYASWTTDDGRPAEAGLAFDVTRPAVHDTAGRAWFPAAGGGADPATGAAEVELAGTARLSGADGTDPLALDGLRLDLADGGKGALRVRTSTGDGTRELALAEVDPHGAAPAVRSAGVTWSGLRATLTEEGARLLSAWSGREFAAGDGLGSLDVTVGTGDDGEAPALPEQPDGTADPAPGPAPSEPPATASPAPEPEREAPAPTAAVRHPALTPGGEQRITGSGFAPGEVVLVAIDADTRYQAEADAEGRLSRTFPVYATATAGTHTVELTAVSSGGRATARFEVRAGG